MVRRVTLAIPCGSTISDDSTENQAIPTQFNSVLKVFCNADPDFGRESDIPHIRFRLSPCSSTRPISVIPPGKTGLATISELNNQWTSRKTRLHEIEPPAHCRRSATCKKKNGSLT